MRILLLSLILLWTTSIQALAETPIKAGDIDIIISPIGYESAGIRFAHSDDLAFYAKLDEFDLLTDKLDEYSVGDDRYEDYSTVEDPNFGFSLGGQYFINDGVYLAAKAGYYTYRGTEEYENDAVDERTFSGYHGSAIIGFEESLGERIAIHSEIEFQFGNREIEDVEIDSNGDLTSGTKTSRFYEETFLTLGLSYTLN
ncbi:hypothetical protein ABMA57_02690 [Saccharospirillum sp. HFRX-1]|uniref:hypothetical protein n=1 Tax=unclassified Saccharospirillum TaxID=2633430 RepID=UPI00371D2C5F